MSTAFLLLFHASATLLRRDTPAPFCSRAGDLASYGHALLSRTPGAHGSHMVSSTVHLAAAGHGTGLCAGVYVQCNHSQMAARRQCVPRRRGHPSLPRPNEPKDILELTFAFRYHGSGPTSSNIYSCFGKLAVSALQTTLMVERRVPLPPLEAFRLRV